MTGNEIHVERTASEAVDQALSEIREQDPDSDFFIVGRALTIDQLLDELVLVGIDEGVWLPEMNEEMVCRGRIGTYKGAHIVRAINYREGPGLRAEHLHVFAADGIDFWILLEEDTEASNGRLNEMIETSEPHRTIVDQSVLDFLADPPSTGPPWNPA